MRARDVLGRDVGPDVRVQFTSLHGRVVRSLALGGDRPRSTPLVVILPGLGLPFYTIPTARAVAARGLACTVLDLPGFGSNLPRPTSPSIHAAGLTAARWIEAETAGHPLVVLGHSTGGQAALTAALALSVRRRDFSLVLAGTTFAPEQRRLHRLARATPFAYRDDRLDQIDPVEVYRGRAGIVAMIQSGLHDAPEERIAHLPVPVTVTAGVHDAFVPVTWLDQLAGSASRAPSVRTSLLGGSHNNLFTHPDDLADLVVLAAADALAPPAS
jgi:pimeloyl-ACP methyl ester carboxylesterase